MEEDALNSLLVEDVLNFTEDVLRVIMDMYPNCNADTLDDSLVSRSRPYFCLHFYKLTSSIFLPSDDVSL